MELRLTIPTQEGDIVITTDGSGSGFIESSLERDDNDAYNAAIDGLESLLLALAAQGLPVDSPKHVAAVQITLEAIANQYG